MVEPLFVVVCRLLFHLQHAALVRSLVRSNSLFCPVVVAGCTTDQIMFNNQPYVSMELPINQCRICIRADVLHRKSRRQSTVRPRN